MFRQICGLVFFLTIVLWIYMYVRTNSEIGGLGP